MARNRLELAAFAKINLALDVLHKREDGFHEVKMVMQTVDLADRILLEERQEKITIAAERLLLPNDRENLAWRAAHLLQQQYCPERGVHITLEKRIPLAAGLAGGSADAAAVLNGLNRLWNLQIDREHLSRLAATLGSDIPFCLTGGTMLATGRGEVLAPLVPLVPCGVVLAKPPVAAPTAWVYSCYRPEKVLRHPDIDRMIRCLEQQDLSGVAREAGNVLETVMLPEQPVIAELKAYMIKYGALTGLMSGSGSTVFGLTADMDQAEYIAERLRRHAIADVFVARTVEKVE
ncbi:MAG TPA: 4-(cytidine 5'-diphospho)-2-C-methyl-D-erythritol kinase [Patescibacteria group bacterium]|nr:4-(cytidine 5'-diphospho)-2-C-methyl-D-erythritol kinase [Patescibacteria group bacterium]